VGGFDWGMLVLKDFVGTWSFINPGDQVMLCFEPPNSRLRSPGLR